MCNLINNYKNNPTEKNFNLIFHKYKNLIRHYVSPRFFTECHIEDVICDIYLKLPNIINKFDTNKNVSFSTYLVHSIFKYHQRYKFLYETRNSAIINVSAIHFTADETEVVGNELIELFHYLNEQKYNRIEEDNTLSINTTVEQCVSSLSHREQMILEMMYVDNIEVSTIAEKMGLTYNSTKNVITDVYRKLKPKLLHNKLIYDTYVKS